MTPGPRAALAAVGGGALLLAAAWRVGLALLALPSELAPLAPERVAASLTTPLDERVRAALPRETRTFYELARTTPPTARIRVPRPAQGGTWQGLRTLLFPRRIEYFDPSPDWRAEPGSYVLRAAQSPPVLPGMRVVEVRGELELWVAEGSDAGP